MKIDAALITTDLLACEARAAELEVQGFAAAWSVEGQHDPFLPLALAARGTTRLGRGREARLPRRLLHPRADDSLLRSGSSPHGC